MAQLRASNRRRLRKLGPASLTVLLPWRETHCPLAGYGGVIGTGVPIRAQNGSQYDAGGVSDLQDHYSDKNIEKSI